MSGWVSSSVAAIAGCAGSAVVENFVDMGISYLGEHMLPDDSQAALSRVKMALPQLKAIMGVAEVLKMKDPSTSEWVQQFRQAVDAAEDVLDELEYKKLEDMVKNQDKVGRSTSSSKMRKTCAISGDIFKRLKEAVTKLDEAAAGVKRLLQLANVLGVRGLSESQEEVSKNVRREMTSFLAEREVFGRDVEKDKILGWLKQPTQAQLSSFGIVGVGGLGKTTLAQFAYQEMRGSEFFEKIIWVCVSADFSVKGITATILAELGASSYGDKPYNVLQEILKENILSKKILLILDDVWEDDKKGDWEQLIAPLMFAHQGSKILFTTRMKSVVEFLAGVLSTEHESLVLQDLGEQELLFLFNSYAFRGLNPNNYGDLQAIGDQIVKKLRGNPLAAKVIGSLLNSHMDQSYWRRILNHDSLINIEQAKDVMEVLRLSYYNLSVDLQSCFKFCSIFPEDYVFDKKELIKMWIASGFIRQQSCQKEMAEDIGEDYFNILLRKSFFEYSPSFKKSFFKYSDSRMESGGYVMHDLIYELAQNVSSGECCRVAPNDKSIIIPSTVRHVSIHESEIQMVSHLENIRSLVITTCKEQSGTYPNLFVLPNDLIQKSLRLLKIYAYRSCKLPKEMSCLVHLRYLSIERRGLAESFNCFLPASVYTLYHLQVLQLISYEKSLFIGIRETEMANLVSLRYMQLPNGMGTVCGVHKLTSLQELTYFVFKESGYCINELGTLNNLRRLEINQIENVRDPIEARSANLLGKKSLRSLVLKWTSENNHDNPEQIIDNLQPHPNLEYLLIENYKGQRSSIWMMGDKPSLNLSELRLWNCPYLKKQPIFRQMSYLKSLEISYCPSLEKLPDLPLSLTEFRVFDVALTSLPSMYQSFSVNSPQLSLKSSLRRVEIGQCPNLRSLDGFLQQGILELQGLEELNIMYCEILEQLPMDRFRTFVSLKELYIIACPNLSFLPSLPLSLISLEIHNVAASAIPECFASPGSSSGPSVSSLKSSLQRVRIENWPNLTALNGFFQQENIDFLATRTIFISTCKNLVQIPTGAFCKFVSLTFLYIENCPKMVAVDNQNIILPSKLEQLTMRNCGELEVPLLESSSGLTILTKLTIENCENITCIPSSENVFGSLSELSIKGCDELIELSLFPEAHNVNLGSNLASLKINQLCIDYLSLVYIEPLRSLRSVSTVEVGTCAGVEALPEQWLLQNSSTLKKMIIKNASNLQSLPAAIVRLTALEELVIKNADLLVEIPELPASLKVLKICSSYSFGSSFIN